MREVPSAVRRPRLPIRSRAARWLLAVLLVVVLAAGGAWWMRASTLFLVERVVIPPLVNVAPAQVRAALAPAVAQNLLAVSTGELESRLRALPYVAEAHVYRRFPDALEVELTEHREVAQVKGADGRRWLLAADGRILRRATKDSRELLIVPAQSIRPRPGEHLPPEIAKAVALAPLLDDGAVWPEQGRPSHVNVEEDGRCQLVLADGGEVRLGEPVTLKQKLMVASAYVDPNSSYHTRFLYVDVSVARRPVVREIAP